MRNALSLALALVAAALLSAPSARADEEAIYAKLMKEKAVPVVSVKLTLAMKISGMGQSQEHEINNVASGIVVDPSGLVLVPSSAFDASSNIPRRMRAQFKISTTPVNIRVVFPGDTKEYDAILGAKDSKLGLGFLLIKDLAGKKIEAVDFSTLVEPKLGQDLYGVTRLDQGFDHAPLCTHHKVAGQVSKPRSMWIVQGGGNQLAKPLYTAEGAVAGIVIFQEGVGENSGSRPFLLPMKVATPTIASSLKKSKAELERILEDEEEAADENDADGEAGKKDDEAGEKKEGDAGEKKEGDGK